MSLGDYIRFAIENAGCTQKEIAHQLQIAPQTLNSYINNHRYPDYETLARIVILLKLDANALFQATTKQVMHKELLHEEELLYYFHKLKYKNKLMIRLLIQELYTASLHSSKYEI